ncbi:OLC1v1017405C1 [Oldenlandia corymbosa var. corymbosa]|uniref:OLC1v1017405C1 n=1 Tax=Oldenlandia corymbosa var. corymbosa TaxID=529605 RepID=A0AAV1E9D1_OLDCO|nr:OLC1v1017405C1 [Oldenlandia corymbosa var. corymbosa]
MDVSLEALAMAGEDHSNLKLDAENWEKKHVLNVLNPPPHLLSPTSRDNEFDCHFVFYFPEEEQDCDNQIEDEQVCHLCNRTSNSGDMKIPKKTKRLSEGFRSLGRMMKKISNKIGKFFIERLMKKKKKSKKVCCI